LRWPLAPHRATILYLALSTMTSTGASDRLQIVGDSRKGKSTGSDHHLDHTRYYNLACVVRRSNLGWPPATHWTTISYLALSTTTSTSASDRLYCVWDSRKGKSTGSDHHLAHTRYYNLVCVARRSNLRWPQAPHWATILYLALSTITSTAASDRLYFV